MACEALTFMCYCEPPAGHSVVLRGLEFTSKEEKSGRFDGYLRALLKMLDGRGKMGSRVGASKAYKALNMNDDPESQMMEYAVSIHPRHCFQMLIYWCVCRWPICY